MLMERDARRITLAVTHVGLRRKEQEEETIVRGTKQRANLAFRSIV